MGNAEYELALADLRSKLDSGFLCDTCFFGWLYPNVSHLIHQTVSQIKVDCMCSSTCDKNDGNVPSSKASENEKLELNVRKVREPTIPIRVWASASIPNTRIQISHSMRYDARENGKVYFDSAVVGCISEIPAHVFCRPHFHLLSLFLSTLSLLPRSCASLRTREDMFVIIRTTPDIQIGHTCWFKPDSPRI